MTEEDRILSEQYVGERLDPEARRQFEARLKKEPALSEEVEAQLVIRMGRQMALEKQLEAIADEEKEVMAQAKGIRIWLYSGAVAAACLLIFFLVRGIWGPTTPQRLFEAHFQPAGDMTFVLGDEDAYQKAFQAYREEDYDAAIENFAKLDNLEPDKALEVAFYEANAFLMLKQNKQAIARLQQVLEEPENEYAPIALYTLGMAYLAEGERTLALEAFREVVAQGDVSREEVETAGVLIEELEKLSL